LKFIDLALDLGKGQKITGRLPEFIVMGIDPPLVHVSKGDMFDLTARIIYV
jgi:hypothetical protein